LYSCKAYQKLDIMPLEQPWALRPEAPPTAAERTRLALGRLVALRAAARSQSQPWQWLKCVLPGSFRQVVLEHLKVIITTSYVLVVNPGACD
jgi:hypothetical protein